MTPNLGCIGLTASTLLLSGCFLQQDIKSRECPAFNQPLAKQWQPVESGNTVVFATADCGSAICILESIIVSEPYVASVDVNSSSLDTPICEMTSMHVFSAENNSHEIILNFSQKDNDGANPAEDSLAVRIDVRLPKKDQEESGPLLSRTRFKNLLNLDRVFEDVDNLRPEFIAS